MRQWLVGLFVLPSFLSIFACGAPSPITTASVASPASNTADDTCPLLDAGPPAVCPEGCYWNGEVCRRQRGVIVIHQPAVTDEKPIPAPASTVANPSAP